MKWITLFITFLITPLNVTFGQTRTDQNGVMVFCYVAPFRCAPCNLLKSEYVDVHKQFPDIWFGFTDTNRIQQVNQFGRAAQHYRGMESDVTAYPTIVVMVGDVKYGYRERYRMIGYDSKDKTVLKAMIERYTK